MKPTLHFTKINYALYPHDTVVEVDVRMPVGEILMRIFTDAFKPVLM